MVVRDLVTMLGFDLKDGPLQKYDKEIDSTKAKSNGLATAAKGIGSAYQWAAAAVAVGVGWISKNIIEATVEMEGYRSQIQAFTGDADSAAETLANLRDKTIDPLFGTGNLVNAYKQLRTIGMGAEDTSRMIDVLGDVANGSVENFNALSNVLVRVSTTGKMDSRTMLQLTNAGFSVQDMAQGLGISVEQLKSNLDSGKMSFNDLTRAMAGATAEGGRFYMNAANQALTLGGSIKIIQDAISSTGDAIGTKVAPALANLIGYVTNLIKLGQSGLVDFGAKAFEYLIHVVSQVIIFFEVLQMRMKKFGGAFTPLKTIFSDVFGFLKNVIQSAAPFLMNLAQLFLVAFKPIQAFVKPILESLKPIIQGVFGFLSGVIEKLVPVINGLTPLFSGIGSVIGKVIGPALGLALAIKAVNIAQKAAAVASKIWAGAQMALNAVMSANPIGIIILAVVALIAIIVLLVKNWDKVKAALINSAQAIGDFFKKIWEGIKNTAIAVWNGITGFFKKWGTTILKILGAVIFGIPMLIVLAVRQIIKHWDVIGPKVKALWEGIKQAVLAACEWIKNAVLAVVDKIKAGWEAFKSFMASLWEGIKAAAAAVWEGIKTIIMFYVNVYKTIFLALVTFFTGLWEGIKTAAIAVWEGIKNTVTGVVDSVRNVWNGLADFFTGLWESIKQGPEAAAEYIRNVFVNLWESIKEKFFGFVDTIKEGWEKIKGFFSGIGEGIVNFVTGGGETQTPETHPANDMIITPEGQYSTHPDDYIMAMKNPSSFMDSLARFLGQGEPQLAYAGSGSLMGNAAMTAAQHPNTYNNSTSSNVSNVSAPVSVNVNASGMSPDQASAMVQRGVKDALNEAINGSRGVIPSPEARRN